jgi:hypothetical protein
MQVSAVDFIKSPDIYLNKIDDETVVITRDGRAIAGWQSQVTHQLLTVCSVYSKAQALITPMI